MQMVIMLKKKMMMKRTHMVVLAVCLLLSSVTVLVSRQVRCKISSCHDGDGGDEDTMIKVRL